MISIQSASLTSSFDPWTLCSTIAYPRRPSPFRGLCIAALRFARFRSGSMQRSLHFESILHHFSLLDDLGSSSLNWSHTSRHRCTTHSERSSTDLEAAASSKILDCSYRHPIGCSSRLRCCLEWSTGDPAQSSKTTVQYLRFVVHHSSVHLAESWHPVCFQIDCIWPQCWAVAWIMADHPNPILLLHQSIPLRVCGPNVPDCHFWRYSFGPYRARLPMNYVINKSLK